MSGLKQGSFDGAANFSEWLKVELKSRAAIYRLHYLTK
jgi:hypothetical protein